MKTQVWTCTVALLAVLLAAGLAPRASAADDPRPVVLLIGDKHLEPIDYSAGIPQELQLRRPDWRVVAKVVKDCTITVLGDTLDNLLADVPHADAVILLTGSYEVHDASFATCDAAACGAKMGEVLKALKAKPATANALQAVILPVPILALRLEKPMQSRITDGEPRSKAVADAYRQAAKNAGATVVDLHAFVLGFNDPTGADTRPAWLLGSRGWTLREWGLPYMTDFVCKELGALSPASASPEAYGALKKELEAGRKLDAILAQTCEGLVAHGAALAAAEKAGAKVGTAGLWTVPADLLSGASLDLLVATDGGTGHAGFMAGSAARNANLPQLVVEVDGGAPVTIKPLSYEWQVLDEAAPDKPVPANSWWYNASYQDYFHPIVGGKPGERKQCLLRFPLTALSGAKAKSGTLGIPSSAVTKTATGVPMPDMKDAGPLQVFAVTGPDKNWHCSKATWKTRDGENGWTGGKVDAAKRVELLKAFVASNPPAAVKARAEDELARLKP